MGAIWNTERWKEGWARRQHWSFSWSPPWFSLLHPCPITTLVPTVVQSALPGVSPAAAAPPPPGSGGETGATLQRGKGSHQYHPENCFEAIYPYQRQNLPPTLEIITRNFSKFSMIIEIFKKV